MSFIHLQGKTLLLVSVGSTKKRFILECMKELGLRVVALQDQHAAWAEEYVSDWIIVPKGEPIESVLKQIRHYCEEHRIVLDGAITFWEEEVPLLAKICEAFGLIGNSYQAALNTRSKFAMQELLRKHGEPAMKQYLLKSEDDLEEAMKTVGFPAVMKPLYGADSLSVVYVNSPEEARRVYKFILNGFTFPYEKIFKYERGQIVYQEYIPGIEFSVECAIQNGVPIVAGIQEKTSMQMPFFVETGSIASPRISFEERKILENEAKAAVVAMGVMNSLAHVELKLMPNGTPQIIEVGSRMGGDYIYSITKTTTGFDLVKAGCEIALGIPVSERRLEYPCVGYAKDIIPQQSGVVIEMVGFEKLAKNSSVVDYSIFISPGDTLFTPPQGFDTAGWILVKGKTYADVEKRMDEIMRELTIRVKEPLLAKI